MSRVLGHSCITVCWEIRKSWVNGDIFYIWYNLIVSQNQNILHLSCSFAVFAWKRRLCDDFFTGSSLMETLIIATMCQWKGQIYGEFCTIVGGLGREKLWVVESGDRNMRMWLAQTWRLGSDLRLQSHMTLLEQGHIPPQQLLLCHLRSVSGIPPGSASVWFVRSP